MNAFELGVSDADVLDGFPLGELVDTLAKLDRVPAPAAEPCGQIAIFLKGEADPRDMPQSPLVRSDMAFPAARLWRLERSGLLADFLRQAARACLADLRRIAPRARNLHWIVAVGRESQTNQPESEATDGR